MKTYDLIAVGSGTGSVLITKLLKKNPKMRIAVIDKDPFGGICLTRACVPSKILVYSADLIREAQDNSEEFGVSLSVEKIDFQYIMNRMRKMINGMVSTKKKRLLGKEQIDYYEGVAEFVKPSVLKVGDEVMKGEKILLILGSEPSIPPIKGIEDIEYQTNKTVFDMKELPKSIVFVGGGFIAAEFGHFFAAMGSKVTIIGRNKQFLPKEEPEVSKSVLKELRKNMTILTNHEVIQMTREENDNKKVIVITRDGETMEEKTFNFESVFIATGRRSNSDLLKPEKGGIETTEKGWIKTNNYLETSQPNVWAFGDANGKYFLKHVAKYEMGIVYHNLLNEKKRKARYDAIPHAIFTYPKIGSVGMKEKEAIEQFGEKNILIGYSHYGWVIKGKVMNLREKDYFVKIIIEKRSKKILGGHIIGPQADVLIHEIIDLMYTDKGTIEPLESGIHIHPTLSEVVVEAILNTYTLKDYHEKITKI
jgi:dihydrolipoamide dehydrogenase